MQEMHLIKWKLNNSSISSLLDPLILMKLLKKKELLKFKMSIFQKALILNLLVKMLEIQANLSLLLREWLYQGEEESKASKTSV